MYYKSNDHARPAMRPPCPKTLHGPVKPWCHAADLEGHEWMLPCAPQCDAGELGQSQDSCAKLEPSVYHLGLI